MVTIAETDRLIIRTWMPEEDAEQAFQIYSDPEVTGFLMRVLRTWHHSVLSKG
jgi:hypothetical protein